MVVGLGEMVELDRTILEISDLPVGYYAERLSVKHEWTIKQITDLTNSS
jgi:hypothetical protein